jgi:hypothetical protein
LVTDTPEDVADNSLACIGKHYRSWRILLNARDLAKGKRDVSLAVLLNV